MNILVIQTAFLGDVILTLPLVQALHARVAGAQIDLLVIPAAAPVLANHPSIRSVIVYDKHGNDAGVTGFTNILRRLRSGAYDAAIIPHRSLRSALLARLAKIQTRIGFDRSSGVWLLTDVVRYEASLHEVERNTKLLVPMGIAVGQREFPSLYPSEEDRTIVIEMLSALREDDRRKMVALAPGSVWNTKRWPKERFAALTKSLVSSGRTVVIVGGEADRLMGEEIVAASESPRALNAAGMLTPLQSAVLIGMSRCLVTNDTAPMHIAVAMRTPVVAIFGATVPSFGFAPYGERDVILETHGLACRPCSIHGGATCPITTFDCMLKIPVEAVLQEVAKL